MTLKSEKMRECMVEELLNLKTEGLRMFINANPSSFGNSYGLITDGTYIIYVQSYDVCGFTLSFEWIPCRHCGSGCSVTESGCYYPHLTKEVFDEAVAEGRRLALKYHANLYDGIDHFFQT